MRVAAIASGFFYAGILVGGDAIQVSLGLPAATVQVFNGVLLVFLIGGDFIFLEQDLVRAAHRDHGLLHPIFHSCFQCGIGNLTYQFYPVFSFPFRCYTTTSQIHFWQLPQMGKQV